MHEAFTKHVFVYGTLRAGGSNDITRLSPAPQWVGLARLRGVMFNLGLYPGVVLHRPELDSAPNGGGCVMGEVYAIAAALEPMLDEIEELYPQQKDEYFKRQIQVNVQGRFLDCIVYEINPAYLIGKAVIRSGDWLNP